MCGAVSAGRLTAVKPDLVNETCTGTSPAPANDAGKVKLIMSQPGIFGFGLTTRIALPEMAVVPIVTVISVGTADLTPVTFNSRTVATLVLVSSSDVTLKGSIARALFVTLNTAARPPGPFVDVKMSGCPGTTCTKPRCSVSVFAPASRMLIATVATPPGKPIGITKLICLLVLPTE